MKRLVVVVVALLALGGAAYAANGDLIVNGNVGVGTSTPQTKLDVAGDISLVKDGKRFTLQYANFGEDSSKYEPAVCNGNDTCNGDNKAMYTCTPSENRTCCDKYFDTEWTVTVTVRCEALLVFKVQ